jgi:DNA-directed RNA polymerase subunit RPC12/RpoP
MSKKHPSPAEQENLANWSKPEGRKLQDYCCEQRMPPGAIKADLSQQAPHNSYGPPMWYADKKVKCRDCGQEFVWTAKAQKRWFEVLKRPIWTVAVRCVPCGRKVRLEKVAQKQDMAEMAKRKANE